MKKVPVVTGFPGDFVTIYLDDIKEIYDLMYEFSPTTKIRVGNIEFDTYEEFLTINKNQIDDLLISHDYGVDFLIEGNDIYRLVAHTSDNAEIGLIQRLKSILEKKKNTEGKSFIYLFVKPPDIATNVVVRELVQRKPKSLFLQDKVPVWLTIVIAIGSIILSNLIQIIAKHYGWIP